ncbi:MAG: aldolase catalytic domain-containing protein [Candidatus Margulisiibacteriota bacterium]
MYRPQIKVLDCSIRDGGLLNNCNFEENFVRNVYRAVCAAGVDYVELGYQADKKFFSPDKYGKWKFCEEDDLKKVTEGVNTSTKISTMIDIGRVDLDQIKQKKDSVVDMIRVACYVKDIDKAIDHVKHVADKGYETTVNIMAISTALMPDLEEGLAQLAESPVKAVYIVDSYGALFSEQIHFLVEKAKPYLNPKGIEVGIHCHNNQQLGFANTIAAIISGIDYLDATLLGIGRGAGNCPLELLISFLKNPKFKVRPLIKAIEEQILPWQKKIDWGYHIPYMITGVMNQHPRTAMALMESEDKEKFIEYFDQMTSALP